MLSIVFQSLISDSQDTEQVFVVFLDPVIVLPQFGNFPVRVEYRGVITPAECVTYFRETVVGQFLRQGHGHLSGAGNGTAFCVSRANPRP